MNYAEKIGLLLFGFQKELVEIISFFPEPKY